MIFFFYFLHNGIQYSVDKRAAFGCAVRFGNLNIFVQ